MKKITTLLFLLAFILAGTMGYTQQYYSVKKGERPPIDLQTIPSDAFEKGKLKIKINESFTEQLDEVAATKDQDGNIRFNISSIDQLNQIYKAKNFKKTFESKAFSSEFSDRHRAWGFHLWYTLYFDEKADIKELVNAYGNLAEVTVAEPEYKKQLFDDVTTKENNQTGDTKPETPPTDWTPNDPSFSLQWHYHNTGQQGGTVDADIDLPEAWDIEKGNSNVIVCIEDMGIQYNHPDLAGNMWSSLGYDFYNNDATIEPGFHGTHVAGTVAAVNNNGTGVSGIAGGSGTGDGVRLMSCQVFTAAGNGGGFELAPIYAADNGACISQNSWGYTSPNVYDQVVLDAIDYFNVNGGGSALLNGGITIFAAGNSSSNGNYYPGYYSGTFSVAGTNNQDIKAWYSNYGTWVDISAPGGETDVVTARGVYSTYTGSSYAYLQGTSMACPHVSGVAALIASLAYGVLTPADVALILRTTADNHYGVNPGYIGQLGSGRLNAYQALLATQGYLTNPPVANFSANSTNPALGQTVTFTDLSINIPTSWSWSFSPNTVTYIGGTTSTSKNPQVQFNALGFYTVTLTATNAYGSDSEIKTNYINVISCSYCSSSGATGTDEWIGNVTFNTINNSSSAGSGYTNYTAISTNVNKGTAYTFTMTVGSTGSWIEHCFVFIDMNQDCDFLDANESFDLGQRTGTGTLTSSITIPAGAATGATRMRVSLKYSANPTSCEAFGYGEVEDYTLNIQSTDLLVDLTAFLEGPYNGSTMTQGLAGLVPLNQPYNTSPWNYTGTESVAAIPANAIDWVLIELRNATTAGGATSGTRIGRKAAFIRNDGRVIGLTGTPVLNFGPLTVTNSLFVIVHHRNHVSVLSATGVLQTGGIYTYNFTTASGQAYGGTLAHKLIGSGVWGLFGGNSDGNGLIDSNDEDPAWENQAGTKGYLKSDFNFDTHSNNKDKDNIWAPNLGKGNQVPN